ncbi:hypothetical protein PINS_up011081 [Pythium insidiosum]|nr:hypothetical protein PINS_up011081 [Pythium insidiosum]
MWLATALQGSMHASALTTRLEMTTSQSDETNHALAVSQQWLAHEQTLRSELLNATRRCVVLADTEDSSERKMLLGVEMERVASRVTGCEGAAVFAVQGTRLEPLTEMAEAFDARRRQELEHTLAHWGPQSIGCRLKLDGDETATLVVSSEESEEADGALPSTVVGIVVLHGSGLSSETVEATLVPWLRLWLTRLRQAETTRCRLLRLQDQVSHQQRESEARELEALERKRCLSDVERRRLETAQTLERTLRLWSFLVRWIETASTLGPSEGDVWATLVTTLSGVEGICGVELVAPQDDGLCRLASSLSANDADALTLDPRVARALRQRDCTSATLTLCLGNAPQSVVRIVWSTSSHTEALRC